MHPWRLNLNSGYAVMQMDVSVGRACAFLLVFCVFAWTVDFWSFVHFQRCCMVLGIYERSGACAKVEFEFRARSYAD